MKKQELVQRLMYDVFQSMLLAALVALALPDIALAQGSNLGTAAQQINPMVGQVAPLISTLFWVGGAVMVGAGALKLKEHAENPTQNPLRQGVGRIAVGAALLAVPFFADLAINTLSVGNTSASYNAFTAP